MLASSLQRNCPGRSVSQSMLTPEFSANASLSTSLLPMTADELESVASSFWAQLTVRRQRPRVVSQTKAKPTTVEALIVEAFRGKNKLHQKHFFRRRKGNKFEEKFFDRTKQLNLFLMLII